MAKKFFRSFEHRGSEFSVFHEAAKQRGWWVLTLIQHDEKKDDEELLRVKLPDGDIGDADNIFVGGYLKYWRTAS